jgi:hypothetical protein
MRKLPLFAWLGLLIMLGSELGMLVRIHPFAIWHTPIAWTGYILLIDGIVWKRRSNSWLRNARSEMLFMACASVPIWVVFEIYNKFFIRNWYYVGLPEIMLVRYAGYAWAFATILPAIFETADLVSSVRDRRWPRYRADPPVSVRLTPGLWLTMIAGAAMLAVPIAYPSTYLAAPVWLGFIFGLDPMNAWLGNESILGDWRAGHHDRLINLAIAGLLCGLIWEFWNYWAQAKWIYNVPILPHIKLFEMPIAGFAGFPPFAIECFAMYVTVRHYIWRGGERPVAV